MYAYFEQLFAPPTLPGTILLLVCFAYWGLMVLGAVDLDLFDFDVPSPDEHGSGGVGMASLKFLNFGDVPLMIWLTFFSVAYIASSMFFDHGVNHDDNLGLLAAAIARSSAVGLVVTKLLTQPLRGRFDVIEPNEASSLIGRTCTVTTGEVTDRFGQARIDAEGAPLLVHVRSAGGVFRKNQIARIVAYDGERAVFLVEPVAPEPDFVPSEPPQREAL